MKRCTLCDLEKDESEFYPCTPWCKTCKSRYARHYYADQKSDGPFALITVDNQFVLKIYRGQIVKGNSPKFARSYATYYNADMTRRKLGKAGTIVKIVPLKDLTAQM